MPGTGVAWSRPSLRRGTSLPGFGKENFSDPGEAGPIGGYVGGEGTATKRLRSVLRKERDEIKWGKKIPATMRGSMLCTDGERGTSRSNRGNRNHPTFYHRESRKQKKTVFHIKENETKESLGRHRPEGRGKLDAFVSTIPP